MKPSSLPRARMLPAVAALLAGLATLGLYLSTMAPGLSWAHHGADGGDLIAAAVTGGVPHPTGYPTYCLLADLFARLPLGSLAYRFNLFSALSAAAAVGLLAAIAVRLFAQEPSQRNLAPALGLLIAVAAACAPTFWSQALVAEVYAPSALALCLALYLALRIGRRASPAPWAALGLTLGLGLGLHVSLALAFPGLALLAWPGRTRRGVVALALGLLAGLCVYAYLPLAARTDPPVNWGDPRDLPGFTWVVSGALYRPYWLALTPAELLGRLAALPGLWRAEYGLAGLGLAVYGLGTWLADTAHRRIAWGTLAIAVPCSALAVGYATVDSSLYLLPAFLVGALWIGAGVQSAWLAVSGRFEWLVTAAGLLALVVIPASSLATHYAGLDLRHDQEATRWLDETLAALPEGALVITGEDRHTLALAYARWAQGRRPDLVLVDGELLAYPWYREALARRYPDLRLPSEDSAADPAEALARANLGRIPVCLTSLRPWADTYSAREVPLPSGGALWELGGLE
ncbi:MAG: protein O-mannosyl-transferase family [Anaerolineae bacterium]